MSSTARAPERSVRAREQLRAPASVPAHAEAARPLGYVPALDGLRGVAIAMVVCFHAFGTPIGGWLGVDLFFVLSGFLITTLLLEQQAERGRVSLCDFYIRRARRLFPALATVVVAYVLAAAVTGRGLPSAVTRAMWAASYLMNVQRAFGNHDLLAGALGHLWSLAQEEQFYLVWPLVIIALAGRGVRALGALAAALAIALIAHRAMVVAGSADWQRVAFAPDTRSDGLLVGCAIACLRRRRQLELPAWVSVAGLAALAALAATQREQAPNAWGIACASIAAATLVVAAVGSPSTPAKRLLELRPLVRLGVISYSLYLWHEPVRWLLHWHSPILAVSVSVGLAAASHRWIEQRFRRRQRRTTPMAEPRVTAPELA